MQKTANYQLNQWEPTDKLSRADFNADNAAIDAALATMGAELGTLATSIAAGGNCRIAWGSYTGDGTYGAANPTKLEFDFKPVVVIMGSDPHVDSGTDPSVWVRGRAKAMSDNGGTTSNNMIQLTWTDRGLSWYCASSPSFQNNMSGYTYHYAALGVAT